MENLLNPGYYTEKDLASVGFKKLGRNVRIARDAIVIGFENISIGSNVQIDSNVTLACSSGYLILEDFIHIGGCSHLSCSGGIRISNFATISQGVRIYSASDDYSGEFMTNSLVPSEFTNIFRSEVIIKPHVIIGSGTVVLPGVVLEQGTAVGALSLVKESTEEFSIYAGSPARKISSRSREILEKSKKIQSVN